MDGLPVTIRTLDPPLHEFLPHTEAEINELAIDLKEDPARIRNTIVALKEQNPMMGHRGCRLGVVYPEITAMQARAIFEAVVKATKEKIKVLPEIMIPLVGHEREFILQKAVVDKTAKEVMAETKSTFTYMVGTMIELPRAALVADKIAAAGAEFFSFGTNDMTQMVFGLSRDDSGKFLPNYLKEGVWERDPFVSIDVEGVGALIRMALEKGRAVNPKLKVGICGEHGGDPDTVKFCHSIGLNYVSCSPFRVPLARLAAAQAVAKPAGKAAGKSAAKKSAGKGSAKKAAK
jgi:pyruvate,orthophosphate dikinase